MGKHIKNNLWKNFLNFERLDSNSFQDSEAGLRWLRNWKMLGKGGVFIYAAPVVQELRTGWSQD